MRYRIISDNPGRIRVRFGTYAFDKPLEGSIRKLAEGRSFVLSAEVHSANGGLLICYRKGSRREVISFIDSLDFRAITPMPEDDATKEIDNNFKSGLMKLVGYALREEVSASRAAACRADHLERREVYP